MPQPFANSVVPTGGAETALTTPSAQQSGLKIKINAEVPAGKVAHLVIDLMPSKSVAQASANRASTTSSPC